MPSTSATKAKTAKFAVSKKPKSPSPSPEPSSANESSDREEDSEKEESEDEEEDTEFPGDNEEEDSDNDDGEEAPVPWYLKKSPDGWEGDFQEWVDYVNDLPDQLTIKDKVCDYTDEEVKEVAILCGADGQGGADAYGNAYGRVPTAKQLRMCEILDKMVVVDYNEKYKTEIKNKDKTQKKTVKSSFNVELKFEKGFFEELQTIHKNDKGEKLPLEFWKEQISNWAYDICNIGNARCRSGYNTLSPKVQNVVGCDMPTDFYGEQTSLLCGHFHTPDMLELIKNTAGKKVKESKPQTVKQKAEKHKKMTKAEKKEMMALLQAQIDAEDDEE